MVMDKKAALQGWMDKVDKAIRKKKPDYESSMAKQTRRIGEANQFLAEEELSFKSQQVHVSTGGTQQTPKKLSKYDQLMQLRGAPRRLGEQNERLTVEEMERLQGRSRSYRTKAPNVYTY
jgi:hypothetical protein